MRCGDIINLGELVVRLQSSMNQQRQIVHASGLTVNDQGVDTRNHDHDVYHNINMDGIPMRWTLDYDLVPPTLTVILERGRLLHINLAPNTNLLHVEGKKFRYLPHGNIQDIGTSKEWTQLMGPPYDGPIQSLAAEVTITVGNEGYILQDDRDATYQAKFCTRPPEL